MTGAAIHLHPDAHDTTGPRLVGRQAAGEGFLRGYLRHAQVDRFHFLAEPRHVTPLTATLQRLGPPARPVNWIRTSQRGALREVGVLQTPGPNLADEAWARRAHGQAAYSLCGVTHTISTARVMDMISQMLIGPVEGHDALICTSAAVRAAVEAQLAGVREWLAQEYGGPRRRPEPQLATIPLGVHTGDFAAQPGQREAWRRRLDIPADSIAALYLGRFNRREKASPALMAISLERAAQACGAPLCWIKVGRAGTEEEAADWAAVETLCPSVACRTVDGRDPEVASVWAAADFFLSLSDNVQESFGLTPVEAMAAGLPCVVTDWNGYRDTVRDGEDGFRVPTLAPPPGDGVDLAYWLANGWIGYTDYVGAAAQYVAVDYAKAAEAIAALASNADLRARMGRAAQARARAQFDWSAVIPQYQALWVELSERRARAAGEPATLVNPFRPDPFRLFAAYPSRTLAADWRVRLAPGVEPAAAVALLTSPLAAYSAVNRPSAGQCRKLLDWLAERSDASVAEAVAAFPANLRPAMTRGLLWIARYGAIELSAPDEA